METSHVDTYNNPIAPEKLAIMKLNLHEHERSFFSEPTTPTGQKSFDFANGMSSSRSQAKHSRQISRSARRSSSFMSSHRNQMSMELTSQAEGKFFALMELMSNASREASSLKEVWSRIISERESFAREREELLEQITEVSEELEVQSTQQNKHGHEAAERKRQVEKLLIELSTAIASVSAEKKKVVDRDNELERTRNELHEIRETSTRSHTDHQRIRSELDAIQMMLKTAEADRDTAREEADRHQNELHRINRERTEVSSRLTDMTSKYETSRKEVLSITDRLKMYDMEREENYLEFDRLKDDARKARARAEESSKDLLEVTEKHDRLQREVNKLRESVRVAEDERDERSHTLEHLRRELKTMTVNRDEADERCSDITLKYDHIKRELLSIKEKLRDVELEKNDAQESVERTREQHRLVIVERDELRDEATTAQRKADDNRRQVINLAESLRKAELALSEVRAESYNYTERIKVLDRERDEGRDRHGHLNNEINDLKEKIVVFQAEIRTITDARDRLRGELEKTRQEYEEITETVTTYNDDSKELEFEIESLRTMLREAREQKERAISARNTADRERDDYIAKYEEKCREMERFEESAASHYHRSSEGRTSSSRVVSSRSNATTVNHSSSG
ncbi:hypothetical protein PMZ80_001605 [Knufia obscura]|uniref:Uncharacterized protein n=2 Tax=Knufia TaxID=430999 RepID=A0AAN8ENW4_9EURO|nr:hypothetical protein PMZ80_001605 [Knufia obscura]KAK5955568.1 hypothetical protein OHC33_003209 [Knufia fluminis]